MSRNRAVALWQDAASRAPQPAKTGVALAVLLAVIVAASFGLAPAELTASGGAVLMVLTGVLTRRSAARALEPKLLAILAGSIGLGAVVVSSGLDDVIADAVRNASGGSVALVVVVFAVVTTAITNLVTNATAASILTPVAISVATELDMDTTTVLALIGTCVSFTFINPFSPRVEPERNIRTVRRTAACRLPWQPSASSHSYCCTRRRAVERGPCALRSARPRGEVTGRVARQA